MPTAAPTAPSVLAPARAMLCPFHDGAATLDLLLAELNPHDKKLFDAVLDLRSLCTTRRDAAACVEQLFRVRQLLGNRHYLAFYRVRCWAKRSLRVEVRTTRAESWHAAELPLDGARLGEVMNTALAPLAENGWLPWTAQVRFVFAPNE